MGFAKIIHRPVDMGPALWHGDLAMATQHTATLTLDLATVNNALLCLMFCEAEANADALAHTKAGRAQSAQVAFNLGKNAHETREALQRAWAEATKTLVVEEV